MLEDHDDLAEKGKNFEKSKENVKLTIRTNRPNLGKANNRRGKKGVAKGRKGRAGSRRVDKPDPRSEKRFTESHEFMTDINRSCWLARTMIFRSLCEYAHQILTTLHDGIYEKKCARSEANRKDYDLAWI